MLVDLFLNHVSNIFWFLPSFEGELMETMEPDYDGYEEFYAIRSDSPVNKFAASSK